MPRKIEFGKPVEFKVNKCPYGCGRSDCKLTFNSFINRKKRVIKKSKPTISNPQ